MWRHRNCISFQDKFGLTPERQILDDNFHHDIVRDLGGVEKLGRPDVVHFALLDVVSTPLYMRGSIDVFVHSVENKTIHVMPGTRLPRTLHRFCGLMSKILANEIGEEESRLFDFNGAETIKDLLDRLDPTLVVALTKSGTLVDLRDALGSLSASLTERIVWLVGGFPHGHFQPTLLELSDRVISISEFSLPAHVVTARLSYEIERRELSERKTQENSNPQTTVEP